jgi:1,4-dihydroxy-2-naphthoate octaprenyltransferase
LDEGNINGPPYRLVTGIVDSRHVLNIGIVSFVVGAIFGSIAVLLSNTMLLIPGFIGAGLALFYSEWPIGYKYKALGELGVFLAYGPLLVISCIYSLTNTISIPDILISVPMGLIIMSVVLANNIRDYEFDRVKTKTLPVIIGKTASTQILKAAIHVSFVTIGFLISEGIIKFQAIIIFTIYPIIIIVIRNMQPHQYISILGIASILYSIVISFH